MITSKDFEKTDIGEYECKAAAVIWGNKTDILIIGCEDYDNQTVTQYTKQSNLCLGWIEENREYIQKILLKNSISWIKYGFEMTAKNFLDRLCLKQIYIEISVRDKEMFTLMSIEVESFFFHGHCHCIEVIVQAQEDGTYKVDLRENLLQFLLEIRDPLREKDIKACEWAKKYGFFYAFDEEGNMLAVVRQQFCVSIDGKLLSETDIYDIQREELLKNQSERSALYFINIKYGVELGTPMPWGAPMPSGFVVKELICKNGVFMITSSSGHKAVSGTFPVIQKILTKIQWLYYTRGATEEEINECYYTFFVHGHQNDIAEN